MAAINITIDDRSPLIRYNPPSVWRLGSRTEDRFAHRYSNGGTFTLSTSAGASASLSFNGTAIWIFGAKRENHGPYDVVLDGIQHTFQGRSVAPLFQTALFSAAQLKPGLHSIIISNRRTKDNQPYLDIDFITWTSEVEGLTPSPQEGVVFRQDAVPQSNPLFKYEPTTAWVAGDFLGSHSSSVSTTNSSGAIASLKFVGDSIMIYGSAHPGAGLYSAQVDDGPLHTFNATSREYVPQTELFFSDNLGPGIHLLKMTNLPSPGQSLTLGFALIRTAQIVPRTAIPSESTIPTTVPISTTTGRSALTAPNHSPSGAVAAIVFSVLAFCIVCSTAFVMWWRRRRPTLIMAHHRILPSESGQDFASPTVTVTQSSQAAWRPRSLAMLDPHPVNPFEDTHEHSISSEPGHTSPPTSDPPSYDQLFITR